MDIITAFEAVVPGSNPGEGAKRTSSFCAEGFEREGVGKREFPVAENTTLGSEAKSKMEFGFLPSEPIEKEKLSLNRGVLGSDPPAGGGRREIPSEGTKIKLSYAKI